MNAARYWLQYTPQCDGLLGLIEKHNRGDPVRWERIRWAHYRMEADLRCGESWIWGERSEKYPDAYVLHETYLRVHFRKLAETKIQVLEFVETPSLLP